MKLHIDMLRELARDIQDEEELSKRGLALVMELRRIEEKLIKAQTGLDEAKEIFDNIEIKENRFIILENIVRLYWMFDESARHWKGVDRFRLKEITKMLTTSYYIG